MPATACERRSRAGGFFTRLRWVAVVGAPLLGAACTTSAPPPVASASRIDPGTAAATRSGLGVDPAYAAMYSEIDDGGVTVPAVDLSGVDPRFLRQVVDYRTKEPPGTIVVDPKSRFLYLVQPNGKAIRYGVGVGKEGLEYKGKGPATVARKAAWPRWTPTPDMIRRDRRNARWASGMGGGLSNPLGARALYLYEGGRDTLYRIHGTNEPQSIGGAVSSGCIRMVNQDIIDLHRRVPAGSRVVVLQ